MRPTERTTNDAPRFLALDDDPAALAYLRFAILERYSTACVETSVEPKGRSGFDVVIVDNEFHGTRRAASLVREMRAIAPDALLLVHSATLDRATLKELIGAGAAGAFDKSSPSELDGAFKIIDHHLAHRHARSRRDTGGSALRAITELLREWNSRLDSEEARLRS